MIAKTFFQQLETETSTARQRFERTPAIARCLVGDVDRLTYQAFLIEAYHHVKHSVPLLMACGSRLPERLDWLRATIVQYIVEEIGQQAWILDDLQHLGVDRHAVRGGTASQASEIMIAYAWDTVTRGNPVSLFGMIYALQKTGSTIATCAAGRIRRALDLGPEAMSFLDAYGRLDFERTQDFEKLIDRLDDQRDREAVLHAAGVFYELFRDIFAGLPLGDDSQEEHSHAA